MSFSYSSDIMRFFCGTLGCVSFLACLDALGYSSCFLYGYIPLTWEHRLLRDVGCLLLNASTTHLLFFYYMLGFLPFHACLDALGYSPSVLGIPSHLLGNSAFKGLWDACYLMLASCNFFFVRRHMEDSSYENAQKTFIKRE